jgi:hypothetical protein
MLFAGLLLFQNELWQAFASLPGGRYALVIGMFAVLGAAFLVARVPREVGRLERDAGGAGPPLESRQRLNVALVLLISQSLQVLVVAAAVGVFFAVFGALAIPPDVQAGFLGHGTDELVSFDLLGGDTELSLELARVSGAIAALSGFYYAIAVLTDSTYREEFLSEITDEMRATFEARARYLRLRANRDAGPRP